MPRVRCDVAARYLTGSLDSLTPGRRDSLNVEDRDRHETIVFERRPPGSGGKAGVMAFVAKKVELRASRPHQSF
jgi:hypothetical protein